MLGHCHPEIREDSGLLAWIVLSLHGLASCTESMVCGSAEDNIGSYRSPPTALCGTQLPNWSDHASSLGGGGILYDPGLGSLAQLCIPHVRPNTQGQTGWPVNHAGEEHE